MPGLVRAARPCARGLARGRLSAEPRTEAPRLRTLALPVEHGGWGLLLEPIALGLLLRPSPAGACLAFAALAAFLARHPLKLVTGDRRRGARHPRTALAERVALAYLGASLAAFLAALALSSAPFWVPLALASPFAALALLRDAAGRSRELDAELAGATALAASVAAITLAGGFTLETALVLWLVLAARAATAILYVRARLRLDRGVQAGTTLVLVSHGLLLLLGAWLASLSALPWLAVAALAALFARAAHGVSRRRTLLKPKQLGWRELGFGSLVVLLLALGYTLGV